MNKNDSQFSVPSNAFGARVAPAQSRPTPRAEGPRPQAGPTHPGFKSSHRDLTPSTAPPLDLPSAQQISDGIAAALHRMDREQAVVNGESRELFDARTLKQNLAKAVAEGTLTNDAANRAWRVAFPHIAPDSVK